MARISSPSLGQVCKQILLNSVDHEYLDGKTLREVYLSEYGHSGINGKACTSYLQGLPSACTVPFWNNEILDILAFHNILATAKTECRLLDDYWREMGHQLYMLIKQA